MGPVRIAILGLEHYHANFWCRAFRLRSEVEVVGVWDWDDGRVARFAKEHAVAAWGSGDELAAACDALAICSATVDHARLVEIAARHGKAALCEKPLATTGNDCAAIAATVKRSGIRFMQSFPKRFDPVNREIADLLAAGTIGRPCLCRIRHGHGHGMDLEFRRAWFVDPAKSGGGTLLDEGVHATDFLRFLFGEPDRVSAAVSSAALGLPVEDTAVATFHYSSGLMAEVATSWCFAAADDSVEIYGTEGTILLSGVDLASRPTRESGFLRVFTRDGWSTSLTVPHFKTGVFHEWVAWAFVDALVSGAPMPITIDDGWRASAMIEAAYRAAKSGRMTVIDYPDRLAADWHSTREGLHDKA